MNNQGMHLIFKEVTDDKNRPLKIYSEFKEDWLRIVILQDSKAWDAIVGQQKINDLSKMLSVSPDKYSEDLISYLQNDSENLSYRLEGDEFIIYYKTGNNVKIKYFFHTLNQMDYSAIVDGLLDRFFIDRTIYLSKATKLQGQNVELMKYNAVLEQKLQELVKRKREEDDQLYSTFILIVNEKKRRIQHLSELLEAFRQGRPTLNPTISVKKKNKTNTQHGRKTTVEVMNELSESDDGLMLDSDEEKLGKVETVCEEINIQPSCSKNHFEYCYDNKQSCEKGCTQEQHINFSLLDSDGTDEEDKLISLPKKNKKIYCVDEKPNNSSIEHRQSADDKHDFPSKKIKSSEGISDKMSSFIVSTSIKQECSSESSEVKGGTQAFTTTTTTTLSNHLVQKSPSTMSTVREDPVETSVTYDTEELLDRI